MGCESITIQLLGKELRQMADVCECVCFYFTHLPEKSYKELDEVHNTVVLGEGDLRKREGRRGEENEKK